MDSHDLRSIVAAIHEAVRAAQQQLQETQAQRMEWFFPSKETGPGRADAKDRPLRPRMVRVALPRPDGSTVEKDVPLFTLVPHHEMHIEEMEVRMKVKPTEVRDENGRRTIKASLASVADHDGHLAELFVRFRAHEPVEGVARLNDELIKTF